MAKPVKVEQVEELRQALEGVTGFVLTDYRGLTVQELQELRRRLRPRGIEYHVVKNTLFSRAAAETGLPDVRALFVGPTAVALTRADEVELAKGIVEEMRTLRTLRITGGVVGGRILKPEEVQSLATLPGRAQLQAAIVGALSAPLSQLAATLQAPLRELIATLAARGAAAS